MFWGLSAGVVDTGEFSFEHVLEDIQTLNEWALEGRLEVTAISLHAYPFVQDRYAILPHGASMTPLSQSQGGSRKPAVTPPKPWRATSTIEQTISAAPSEPKAVASSTPMRFPNAPLTAT